MWYPEIQAMLGKLYVLSLYFTLYAPTSFFLWEISVVKFPTTVLYVELTLFGDTETTAWISPTSDL
jgi:hypothetical protein